ncbi:sensor histidine kinase [Amycolatopsis albispora]|uniref:histidine kinase n=1 Tax=Amycolatopsis albispora TaxID=1804986 RepID=A0A344LJH6_9PSEU|nr:histidine kinase [Amycolatopsis albispora]AXB48200.1 two-component sensor histidine kinase [Amycolatopsis albispora]
MITLRLVPESSHRFPSGAWLAAVGLALFTCSLIPAMEGHGTQFGGLPDRPYDALALVAIALQCVPLALCRRWPMACLALVAIGFTVDQLRGYHSFAGTGLPVAVLYAGSRVERHRRATMAGFTAAYLALAVASRLLGGTESIAGFVMFYLALALAWGLGAALRSSRAAEADRRRRIAEETRVAERTRIARELHDVVTHHVTAMVVQTEAARYLTGQPRQLDESLSAVSDTGRRALTDLRHLLDLLNPEPDTGAAIPALVEQTRRAGQPVEFTEEGTPAGPTGSAGPVAYRVVQEALTNALKYAHGSRTSVEVRHGEREITVQVSTDGSGEPIAAPGGSGRGLDGLRERVGVLGGEFSAGRRSSGGFYVRARIPAGSPS